ncbi:site-specific integrase [Microscilla marina]|uniref:Integrase n=1 Tax=Microscilla marina ATCC 23134 TaxID=313606 RepID=A2A0I5_MICM2|nr:hypothetical protein [Microscilla marina]EAY23857.1 integrase [Microscilla marina ATCC 23134]
MASIKTILYKSKKLKNTQHPVCVNEDKRYCLSLSYNALPCEFDNKTRQKTGKPLSLLIAKEVLKILNILNYAEVTYSQYLIKICISPLSRKRIGVLKRINKNLRTIAEIQGIQKSFTFYAVRHSSATKLKRSGVMLYQRL